jgi:hypothetical protein
VIQLTLNLRETHTWYFKDRAVLTKFFSNIQSQILNVLCVVPLGQTSTQVALNQVEKQTQLKISDMNKRTAHTHSGRLSLVKSIDNFEIILNAVFWKRDFFDCTRYRYLARLQKSRDNKYCNLYCNKSPLSLPINTLTLKNVIKINLYKNLKY